MITSKFLGLVTLAMLVGGCTSYSVHKMNPDMPADSYNGLPFYMKKGIKKQDTTYTRTWIDVKLIVYPLDANGKRTDKSKEFHLLFSRKSFDQNGLLLTIAKSNDVADEQSPEGYIAALRRLLPSYGPGDGCDKKTNCQISEADVDSHSDITSSANADHLLLETLIGNSIATGSEVDYGNPLTFNSTIPLFGTSTTTMKLAEDGTMTEATGAVDTTKLADVIPLHDLLFKRWSLAADVPAATVATTNEQNNMASLLMSKGIPTKEPKHIRDIELAVGIDGYVYKLHRDYALSKTNFSPLKFNANGVSITRVQLQDKAESSNDKKSAITFSGDIKLPEAKK